MYFFLTSFLGSRTLVLVFVSECLLSRVRVRELQWCVLVCWWYLVDLPYSGYVNVINYGVKAVVVFLCFLSLHTDV